MVPPLQNRDFDVDDRSHEGMPKIFENIELETLLNEDACQTQEELASALEWHEKVILQHDNAWLQVAKPVKHTWKGSNGKSYPTRHIPQILRRPIITCSVRWHMVWVISSSTHMKTSQNSLIRDSLRRRTVLPSWYSISARKIGKSCS